MRQGRSAGPGRTEIAARDAGRPAFLFSEAGRSASCSLIRPDETTLFEPQPSQKTSLHTEAGRCRAPAVLSGVMAGLVPAIPAGRAWRSSYRDHRVKPGDDKGKCSWSPSASP